MSLFSRSSNADRQISVSDALPFVAAPGAEKAVELRGLEIEVVVMGLYAETTCIMRFFNPNGRDLEGNLTFPLPDGAVVCGYALDVEGAMVDGVVAPKQEARRILEAEERKGIDPGLVEQVRGNRYRTRIYPIPAGGSRTVRIVYISDLTVEGNDAAYHLPLGYARGIDDVSLRVEVVQAPVTPELSDGVGNLALVRWEDRWVADTRLGAGTPTEDLHVRLPVLPDEFNMVEKTREGEIFFCISRKLPDEDGPGETWSPGRIAVAWDASGSRADIGRDLEFLAELLAGWPEVVVDVTIFRDRVERETVAFEPGRDGVDALLDHLRSTAYDGGTNLTALDLADLSHPETEGWFLFSDGMGTVRQAPPALPDVPVFAVTGQANCNGPFMEHVARQSGGLYLNLLRASAPAAAMAVRRRGKSLRIIEAEGCESLHLGSASGRLTITGRLMEAEGCVRLSGFDAPAESLVALGASASDGRIIARAWAGMEARAAEMAGGDNTDRMLELGRKYGFVTPGASLLVLERLEQYLEYTIEPPESLPEMRTAYHDAMAAKRGMKKEKEKNQIERVVALWRERVAWWEKEFSIAPPKKIPYAYADEGLSDIAEASMEPEMEAMSPPEPMAAMPPPSPAPAEDMDTGIFEMTAAMDLEEEAEEAPPDAGPAAGGDSTGRSAIHVKPWSPDTPYLSAIRAAGKKQAYPVYLNHRPEYARSPSFFLDCGDYFLTHDARDHGLRVLSNLLEIGLDEAPLMRMYAWRLLQAGELESAISILEKVRADREDEPQSHRDLALALAERWENGGGEADALRAMELLYDVISRTWDRFPEIELIALMELNRLIHLADRAGIPIPERIDDRLRKLLDLGVRISMSWDADLTDVDLHVFEPTGEHAYYGHNLTGIGGLVSRDFTQGYGPEEYVLKKAVPGTYTIKAHYYGSSQQSLWGPCTIIATVFTDYGRPREKKQVLTLRLDKPGDEAPVGEICVEAGKTG